MAAGTPQQRQPSLRDDIGLNPFDTTPPGAKSAGQTYPSDGEDVITSRPTSPSKAKRAIEAQLAETERRIQDASKLGTALLQQKEHLAASLKQIDDQRGGMREIDPNLKQKLADLEKETTEAGKDAVKFLKTRKGSTDLRSSTTPHTIAGDSIYSPSKPQAKPRNGNDSQLAKDLGDSLVSQVRNLQNSLAEKELALKKANQENANLLTEADMIKHRLKGLDESEQRFKDENWALETRLQDVSAQLRDSAEREQRLTQSLNQTRADKSSTEREFEDLKATHNQLADDHGLLQKKHDAETTGHRRNLASYDGDREVMQKKIDELTSQNIELAKAVAQRDFGDLQSADEEPLGASADQETDGLTPENSPPPSPVKATPRHGALESETLKSSLTHAHRMIQNLKNNIHREKTEKVELKRLLQDARDELESNRQNTTLTAANSSKRRKPDSKNDSFKRPARPEKLGALKKSEEWEEYETSPVRPSTDDTDATDAFETADERQSTTTDAEYHTGAESAGDDGSETETERAFTSSVPRPKAPNRISFQSTASDEYEDMDDASPRPSLFTPRSVRALRDADMTPSKDSPASFVSNSSQPRSGQDLAAELAELDNSSIGTSTPSRSILSRDSSPEINRKGMSLEDSPLALRKSLQNMPNSSLAYVAPFKASMVDAGMMTDPWSPPAKPGVVGEAAGVAAAAGAVIGSVVSRLTGTTSDTNTSYGKDVVSSDFHDASEQLDQDDPQKTDDIKATPNLVMSSIISQESLPIMPTKPLAADAATMVTPVRQINQATWTTPAAATRDNATAMTPLRQSDMATNTTPAPQQSDAATAMTPRRRVDGGSMTKPVKFATSPITTPNHSSRPSQQSILPPLPSEQAQAEAETPASGSTPFTISVTGQDGKVYRQTTSSSRPGSTSPPPASPSEELEPHFRVSSEQNEGRFQEPTLDFKDPYELRTPQKPASAGSNVASGFTPLTSRSALRGDLSARYANHRSVDNTPGFTSLDKASTPSRSGVAAVTPPQRAAGGRTQSLTTQTAVSDPALLRSLSKRTSPPVDAARNATVSAPSGSMPPLPPDHKEVIAAAASRTNSMMSAVQVPFISPSTARPSQAAEHSRPRSASNNFSQSPLQQRKPFRNRAPSLAGRSDITRRSSVSSFASELDVRFNISTAPGFGGHGGHEYDGFGAGTTDPRMIAAITQTMIGEFLWKYTRKAGRGTHSENRHRRFFWIHPYTRTLYWSSSDPSIAGRSELKAKSVAIEAVRVVTDNNPMPPGLHPKSIVVVTPGRSIKFTTPTSQRHETWFNALSYLLLRNAPEREEQLESQARNIERSNTMTSITSDDINEFDAGWSTSHPAARSSSRLSRRSFGSTNGTSTANARTSALSQFGTTPTLAKRAPSPSTRTPSLAVRQAAASAVAASSRASRQAMPSSINYSNTATPSNDASAPESPAQVDEQGFKKPKLRPTSTANAAALAAASSAARPSTSTSASASASPSQASTQAPDGRLRSLTGRLRAPLFRKTSDHSTATTKSGHKRGDSAASAEVPPDIPRDSQHAPQRSTSRAASLTSRFRR